MNRTFSASEAKGGSKIESKATALLLIEYQNEFATAKGKMHDAVKGVMDSTNMLKNSVAVTEAARKKGIKVMHCAITFKEDMSDNPNKALGILKGCADGQLFINGTWNAAFCDEMTPRAGDIIISGKRGLDAFPGTDLEEKLVEHKIETIAIAGFLTNCCVESTMRTAFEKGFNVVTLADCTACTSQGEYDASVKGTFGMFSTPMISTEFLAAAV